MDIQKGENWDNIPFHAMKQSVLITKLLGKPWGTLREVIELLEKIVRTMPVGFGIYEYRERLIPLYISDRTCEMFGFTREEYSERIKNGEPINFTPDLGQVNEGDVKFYDDGEFEFTAPVKKKTGEEFWMWVTGVETNEDGDIPIFYCAFLDVTERRTKTADEREKFEEVMLLQELSKADYDATVLINLSQNRVENFTGEGIPKSIRPGMEAERFFELFLRRIAEQENKNECRNVFNRQRLLRDYREGKRNYSMDLQFYPNSQGHRWGNVALSLARNPQSRDILAFLRGKNITKQKMTEITLSDVIRYAYDFVLWIDMSTDRYEVVSANPSGYLMPKNSGRFSRDHLEFVRQYVPENERAEVFLKFDFNTIADALDENPIYQFTYNLVDESGKQYVKRTVISYVDPAAKVILVSREDISEAVWDEKEKNILLAQALDEEAHSKRRQEDFFSRFSHDLRTPLNSLLGISRIAVEELDSAEATRKYLEDINNCGEFMLELVNDILDLSKIESGSMALNLHPFRHSELIVDIRAVFGPLAAKKKIELIIDNGEGDIPVLADKLRLKQIAFNLLSNALKFTPEGGRVEYKVVRRTTSKGKVYTTIGVSDNGIGMSEEFQRCMFEPFSQENSYVNSGEQGTGLGLAIAKHMVELMGGKISGVSGIGKGTTFTVTIPFIHYDGTPEIEQRARTLQKDYRVLMGRRVLICEDHPLNSMVVTKMLEKKDVLSESAENGKMGIDMFMKSPPGYYDAILMDVRMPQMSGLEVTKTIRMSEREDAKTIPIIAMTANAFVSDKRQSLDAGMSEYLCKPIQQEELYDVLVRQIFPEKGVGR